MRGYFLESIASEIAVVDILLPTLPADDPNGTVAKGISERQAANGKEADNIELIISVRGAEKQKAILVKSHQIELNCAALNNEIAAFKFERTVLADSENTKVKNERKSEYACAPVIVEAKKHSVLEFRRGGQLHGSPSRTRTIFNFLGLGDCSQLNTRRSYGRLHRNLQSVSVNSHACWEKEVSGSRVETLGTKT